jgi:3-hydroxyisobutyrate dehydrogenase-like beta-hydroxyacid dehydrogenase
MMRIGCLGVGNMGQPMAGKLLDAGHELWVYDVREDAMLPLLERQARRTISAKELADTCDTIIVSLPTLESFRRALSGPDGLLAGKAIKTLVNTCTVGVPFVREIESECAAADVTVIDVPISGGVAGARAGTLAMMVSGNPAKVAELMPVFQQWGKTIVVAGDRPGAAQIMKLTNNMLCAVALVATSEAMTMSGKAGIPDDAMLEVLNNGTGRNFATMHLFPEAVLPRTFDFGATIEDTHEGRRPRH